jgi:recombination protein RecT
MTTSPLRDRAAQADGNGQPGTDVAVGGQGATTVAGLIRQLQPELQRALPAHLDADRMARLALTTIRNTPKLAECTPHSLAGALLTAAALGLEVGTGGEAYLVPYKRECTLIVGYQGLAKLFWQSPLAKHLDAQAVYSNDDFDYAYGLGQYLRHKPARGSRGDLVCYYAVAELTTGGSAFVVLSPEEVKKLRQGKVGTSGDIADPMRWMERKTVLRQLLKMLPRSATLNTAITVDERYGSELYRDRLDDARSIANPATQQIGAGQADAADDDQVGDPRKLTPATHRKIMAQFGELNITEHDGRVAYCGMVVGHPVESTNDLTRDEASLVIDAQAAELDIAKARAQQEPPPEDGRL